MREDRLSSATARKVSWTDVEDSIGSLSLLARSSASAERSAADDSPLTKAERDRIRQAFQKTQGEFEKTLHWLRSTMRLVVGSILVVCGASVAGGALLQVSPWYGVISIAGITGLFLLLRKAWALARDQAMLELLPKRYDLAVELCHTRGDLEAIVDRFLSESASLRDG